MSSVDGTISAAGDVVPTVDLAGANLPLRIDLHEALDAVLSSGQFILGPFVERFEETVSAYLGVRHAVGVGSGADALELSLRALSIGPGDEVITVANSFVATAAAIAAVGATPVFVDVDDDENVDVQAAEAAITPKTAALLPVHLRGRPARMDRLCDVARAHGLAVVEDAAQAMGALLDGRAAGTFGDLGCFSLHPLKVLSACGDGGVVVTDDDELAARVRLLRNHGLQSRDVCVVWGRNSRLDALQAAFLSVKLRYLPEAIRARRGIAADYIRAFAELPVSLPLEREDEYHTYSAFVVQVGDRDAIRRELLDRGVQAAIHYPTPIHLQPAARGIVLPTGGLPRTEEQASRILSLPIFAAMSGESTRRVIDAFVASLASRGQITETSATVAAARQGMRG